jgi:O-acetyl-ADP-ribose deacetylase (regulator of RNase III)
MIEIVQGNLLAAKVDALVNTVNTEGVMGKGIALQFRQAFPAMYKAYAVDCKAGRVELGRMHVFDLGGLLESGPRWIINFPTKGHWKSRSRLGDISKGLESLISTIRALKIRSIAIPPLGCGHGGLDWNEVRPLIEKAFENSPEVHVQLFAPSGAPAPVDMPNRTKSPELTLGRAALIALIDDYLQGLFDPNVTLLEIHKLMYFLQEAGQELKLNYQAELYGPYALNLRHVLIKLEGHMITGYGDGADDPDKPIELVGGAAEAAREYIAKEAELQARMARVRKLIEGYEDPYGLELLSSIHWVMCRDPDAKVSADAAIDAVYSWNDRKRRMFKREHLAAAWQKLQRENWASESRSAIH